MDTNPYPTTPRGPIARVLLIHHITCQCGAIYTYPTDRLLFRYKASPNAFDLRTEGAVTAGLPYELEHLKMRNVLSCEKCFETFDASTELFPELIERNLFKPVLHDHRRAPPPSKAIPLSDF